MKIIECIPNFSEGQNKLTLSTIAKAIGVIEGVKLLHQSTGYSANRTVFTFAGEMDAVFEAAFQAIKVSQELIDMRSQQGTHPRIGACDVCPFVPISGISMEELITESKRFSKRVNEAFNIPIFLYEASASDPNRKNLAKHRIGGYEALDQRIKNKKSIPDFGNSFNPRFGGMVCGARNFLVAYNINLSTKDDRIAQEIAYDLRELGRPVDKKDGKTIYKPGILKAVKAIGWYIPEFELAQVSINLIDYKVSPIHQVFESTKEIAANYGVTLKGSELIGLIPKQALLEAGNFYAKGIKKSEQELMNLAVEKLGLNCLEEFDLSKRVLELALNHQ